MSGKRLFHLLLITCLFVSVAFMTGCTPEYEVEVQADPEEAGEIEGEGTYEEGKEVAVEVEPEEGYEFEKWEKDNEKVSSEPDFQLEVKKDTTLEAQFEKIEHEVILELNDEEKGEVSGSGTYEEGEKVTVEADSKEGYTFIGWEIDGEEISQDQEYELEVETDKEVIAQFEEVIEIPDEELESAISNKINKFPEEITASDMKGIKSLKIGGKDVSDLTGIEYATNVERLRLSYNKIEDITPLENLTNLEELRINDNLIKDISPLSELTNLERLQLCRNKITDISPLENLINLEWLVITNAWHSGVRDLTENQITDISALAELENLSTLFLNKNQITDISLLKETTELRRLKLGSNEIENIDALGNLKNLKRLGLSRNDISDVNSLSGLNNLRELDLGYNLIADFAPIEEIAKLKTLRVMANPGYEQKIYKEIGLDINFTNADFLRG